MENKDSGQDYLEKYKERLKGSRNGLGCSPVGLFLWLGLVTLVILWAFGVIGGEQLTEISYTRFRDQLQAGNVSQVTFSAERLEGVLKQEAQKPAANGEQAIPYSEFITYLPPSGAEDLLPLLEEENVEVRSTPGKDFSWGTLLVNALPILLLLGLGYMMMRGSSQGRQSLFSVGKNRATLYDRRKEGTTFDDVAGSSSVKTELREIIEFLKNPARFRSIGGEMPRGVLIVGPPGTGKTLLARAVAGEAEVPFYSITGSDFMEMFVGVGASRVRNMFADAKKSAPAIIFIDELDSIGRQRGSGLGGGHDEREQTLNQLLSEMDGFEPNQGVVILAATNRPDILDPALLRPGRFDRRITVELPTMPDREEILRIHARDKKLAEDIDLNEIARGTPGFSGADLENLLNEAALLAARDNKDRIEREDIENARDKVLMGLARKNLVLTEKETNLLAYHEGGHAVVASVLPNADPIHKVTIVPRGRAMGLTQQLPEQDKYIYQWNYLLDRLSVMLGGRAAEELVFGTRSSGAENDLKQATKLSRKMVLEWGMSERLGHRAYGGDKDQVFLGEEIAQQRRYSEATSQLIDQEIKAILDHAFQRAREVLQDHRQSLDDLAETLLEQEELSGVEVLALLDRGKKGTSRAEE